MNIKYTVYTRSILVTVLNYAALHEITLSGNYNIELGIVLNYVDALH